MAGIHGDEAHDCLACEELKNAVRSRLERALLYTPEPGDVVVLEVEHVTSDDARRLKEAAEAAFGLEVKVAVVSGAHFAGVVRPGDAA